MCAKSVVYTSQILVSVYYSALFPRERNKERRDLSRIARSFDAYLRGDGGKVPGIRGVLGQNSFRLAFGQRDEGVYERHRFVCVFVCARVSFNEDLKGTLFFYERQRFLQLFKTTKTKPRASRLDAGRHSAYIYIN